MNTSQPSVKPEDQFITLTAGDGSTALVAPQLGGWLLRYARPLPGHGLVEALHCTQAVIDRYPREMYAGNPILFPLVSFNRAGGKEHHYEWNGKLYEMSQHGFARRSNWTVIDQSATSVAMELTDNETTRANYPFAFRHRITYRLTDGRLHWEQVIENRSAEVMPFSAGFHPYFAVPLTSKGERSACFIEIPEAKRLISHENAAHFTSKPFPAQNWSVQEDVAGTMFLTGLKKQELVLVDPASSLEVIFNFEEAPQHRFVALWSKTPDEPYYCLEPWTALPNSFASPKDHGLILLNPRENFRAAMWLELRPMA
jgi:galactose mutarotase-like enzyme